MNQLTLIHNYIDKQLNCWRYILAINRIYITSNILTKYLRHKAQSPLQRGARSGLSFALTLLSPLPIRSRSRPERWYDTQGASLPQTFNCLLLPLRFVTCPRGRRQSWLAVALALGPSPLSFCRLSLAGRWLPPKCTNSGAPPPTLWRSPLAPIRSDPFFSTFPLPAFICCMMVCHLNAQTKALRPLRCGCSLWGLPSL